MERYEVADGCEYVLGDAFDVLNKYRDEAAAVFLDDAWASPERITRLEAFYDTHPFTEEMAAEAGDVDTSTTSVDILSASHDALKQGGWLVSDAQDWVAPHIIQYLVSEWGDASQAHEEYDGGGYRKVGGVTFLNESGTPSRQTKGTFLSRGGYFVVFAHKGPTDRKTDVSARQLATQPRVEEDYGWMSLKPIEPYANWIRGLVDPGELILVPCAGTAPAALAAERVFGDDARYVCIDTDKEAFEAFKRRREAEL